MILYEDLSDLFLDLPMTLSLFMCVQVLMQHMTPALQLPKSLLRKAVGQACANMALAQARSSPSDLVYALCWLMDCELLTASHSQHLFKAHAFKLLLFISLGLNIRDLHQGHLFTEL